MTRNPGHSELYRAFESVLGDGIDFWMWLARDFAIFTGGPIFAGKIQQPAFLRMLRNTLPGHKIVITNPSDTRKPYVLISYLPLPPAQPLVSKSLDLSQQVGTEVPIGSTRNGDLWLPIEEMGHVLIAGSTGSGKSVLMHSWIISLLHGQSAELYLYDGKGGVEFSRYVSAPGVAYNDSLTSLFDVLSIACENRAALLADLGMNSIAAANKRLARPMQPVVVFIDEVAVVEEQGALETLTKHLAHDRYLGVHVVVGTQRSTQAELAGLAKANLTTRIAFRVPQWSDSKAILGRTGAEKLPRIPGRLLLNWNGRLIKAQAFSVGLPPLEQTMHTTSGKSVSVPVGIDLKLLQRAKENGNKVTQRDVQDWSGYTQWNARKWLLKAAEKGWVTKDTQQNGANVLSEVAIEILDRENRDF